MGIIETLRTIINNSILFLVYLKVVVELRTRSRSLSLSLDFLLFFCQIQIVFNSLCRTGIFVYVYVSELCRQCKSPLLNKSVCLYSTTYLLTFCIASSLQYQEIDTSFSKKCKLGDYVKRAVQIRLITFTFFLKKSKYSCT